MWKYLIFSKTGENKVRISIAMQHDLRSGDALFAAEIFYFCISNDRGTTRFLTPFFHSREYSHVISASVIEAIRDLNRCLSTR
jgi:hypothetical protein